MANYLISSLERVERRVNATKVIQMASCAANANISGMRLAPEAMGIDDRLSASGISFASNQRRTK